MAKVFEFKKFQTKKEEENIYNRWVSFYKDQPHDEVLESLVFEHENQFPLRSSDLLVDRMRHKALIHVLQSRAQSEFLQGFLNEIEA